MNKSILIVLAFAVVCMFASRSNAQSEPLQMTGMQVTDLSVATAFISWTTDQEVTGNKIEITSPDSTWQVDDTYANASYVHYVQVTGLQPSTEYTFNVVSAGSQWDNDGEEFKFSTLGLTKPPGSKSIFGVLEDSWGNPIGRCLVRYWLYNVEEGASLPRMVLTDANGDWNVNVGLMFNATGTDLFLQNGDDLFFFEMTPNYWTSARDSVALASSSIQSLGTSSIQVIDPNASEPGDLDGNGAINIFDLLDILKVIGGKVTPDPRMSAAADVDASGKIDIFDLLELLKLMRPADTASI
jgi:hypothetical protein